MQPIQDKSSLELSVSSDSNASLEGTQLKKDDIDNLKIFTDKINDDESALLSLGKKPGTFHRDIIFAIIQIRLPEAEAERDWKEILKHKFLTSEKLGRNVGIHVATLDYYTNIKKRIVHPKIMDAREYLDTASRALTDDLTKAYSRQFFDQELSRNFSNATSKGTVFSLIMLDLDHFKIYNDLNGHIKGDLALIETVRVLHAVCSTEDTVARYGGEEFAIILPSQRLDIALRTAENIRSAIYDYRFVNEQMLPIGRLSASLGVTSFRPDMHSPREMVEEADVALYRAKNSGRNTIKAFFKGQGDS
jgi:diguanylate cyclase (GGDEF)-like protein